MPLITKCCRKRTKVVLNELKNKSKTICSNCKKTVKLKDLVENK